MDDMTLDAMSEQNKDMLIKDSSAEEFSDTEHDSFADSGVLRPVDIDDERYDESDDDAQRFILLSDSAENSDSWNEGLVTMYQQFLASLRGDIINGRFR